jgi:hypothetical protein
MNARGPVRPSLGVDGRIIPCRAIQPRAVSRMHVTFGSKFAESRYHLSVEGSI